MITRDRKPNSVSYYRLISGFCREGNLEEAKGLFADMKKREFRVDSALEIASGKVDDADELIEEIKEVSDELLKGKKNYEDDEGYMKMTKMVV
ncbi:putative pentatricopeptide [Medicago truncatula]|uniref:PPR repeat protein n=1 Tax=Medicago truncatula TaxID=3880 RepID=G7J8J4_MEDTR|nr:PPR repeat protein [Medicago truncatula]RHN71383.1 putative pentatricopeptide [Medicago truncatula]